MVLSQFDQLNQKNNNQSLFGEQNVTKEEIKKTYEENGKLLLRNFGFEISHTELEYNYIGMESDNETALVPYFKIKSGSISKSQNQSFEFSFNSNRTVYLFISDPGSFTHCVYPSLSLHTYIEIRGETIGYLFYFKVLYLNQHLILSISLRQ